MYKRRLIFLLFIYVNCFFAQTKDSIINPKGTWFFGVELGTNKITSFELSGEETSFQGGFLAEYYFAKQWSVFGKIKYFKTGVSFNQNSSLLSNASSGEFEGAEIAIPASIKWEFRLYKNLRGNIKSGLVLNLETSSSYKNYFPELEKDFKKINIGFTLGYGLNYFLSKKNALFIDYEIYIGGTKGNVSNFIGLNKKPTINTLFNLGYKRQFNF